MGDQSHFGGMRGRAPLQRSVTPRWSRRAIRFALLAGVMGAGVFAAWAIIVSIPSIDNIQNRIVGESTKIYDRTGNVLLFDVHGTMRRTEVPLEAISPHIRNATIAIEDATFYSHHGFRPMAFLRAILVNAGLREGFRGQGGSTLTQQVVKNTLLTHDKTLIRKAKEIILALKLEKVASKDQILAIYLNEVGYGGTVYGVEEAAQYFFNKHAADVTLAEAAYLAALPQAPTRYSPYGSRKNELDDRKNLVLARMQELGYISDEEYGQAVNEEVAFSPQTDAGIKAPHFVFYVREYLEEKYGPEAVANEGLRVITTLDYDLQQKAEDIVAQRAPAMQKNFNASNTGLVAVDPTTGHVLTMIGSKDYFDDSIDGQVNVTLAKRQPGSSFKPFVYATAFEKGYTPETIVFDLQTQFSTACKPTDVARSEAPCYSPQNYDGVFHGPMTLRNALAQSMNIPAVKTLHLAGIKDSIETATDMGITTLTDPDRYGLTLVLGGGEVTLLQLTSAYGVFGNDGVRVPPTGILRVEDSRGNVLESYEKKEARALDPQIARLMNNVLSDNEARTPEFGANSPLYFPGYRVADKTGTTNDFRDVWIVGYTPGISIGAWAGNNDNSPMERKIAAFIIAPLWHEFFEYALEKYPSSEFAPPAPDPDHAALPPVLKGEWNTNPTLGIHDILYWVPKNNPRSPGNSQNDSQFPYWEYPVLLWSLGASSSPTMPGSGPSHPGFLFAAPTLGAQLPGNQPFQASVRVPFEVGISRVSYYLNNTLVGIAQGEPFTVAIQPNTQGPAILKAIADTVTGQQLEAVTSIFIQ